MKDKYSDEVSEEIYDIYSDLSVTALQRNNAKAILKKDLALMSSVSDLLTLLSIICAIVSVTDKVSAIMMRTGKLRKFLRKYSEIIKRDYIARGIEICAL